MYSLSQYIVPSRVTGVFTFVVGDYFIMILYSSARGHEGSIYDFTMVVKHIRQAGADLSLTQFNFNLLSKTGSIIYRIKMGVIYPIHAKKV